MDCSADAQVTESERFLLVRSGASRIALPIRRVKKVLPSVRAFPVPGSRPELLGLLQVGGEPVPVLDLGALLDEDRGRRDSVHLTILVAAGPAEHTEVIGLAVHEALSVVAINSDDVRPTEDGPVRGDAAVNSEVVRILDLGRLDEIDR